MEMQRFKFIFSLCVLSAIVVGLSTSRSQAQETTRVSILVQAKPISEEKEIIQLPATNLPTNTGRMAVARKKSMNIKPAAIQTAGISKASSNAPKKVVSEKLIANNPKKSVPEKKSVSTTKPAVAIAQNKKSVEKPEKASPTIADASKPEAKNQAKPSKPAINELAQNEKTNTTQASPSKASENSEPSPKTETSIAQNQASASVVLENNINDTSKISQTQRSELDNHVQKENEFNYFWLGLFLILTGIVFGLLFGKVAFLISAVGVGFILIGYWLR
jgi:Ca2+-dependent lipid-binding protein